MDYRTKKISREKIRNIAMALWVIFDCKNKYYFDVIKALEKMPTLFSNVSVEILSDDDPILRNVPATTIPDMKGNYSIKVKESVYEKAYFKNNGGYRMHIMHEISHCILFMIGYIPYFDRAYKNNELDNCESIEWQAKALAGETLINYRNTFGMSVESIMARCKVSKDAALKRISLDGYKKSE